jgi:uncharacterized RDD family membrane protein YckC
MSRTLRLAGFFTRAVALALDGAIVTAGALAVGTGVVLALRLFGVGVSSTPVRAVVGSGGWLLLVALYFGSFWTLTGETPGMRCLGIRVVTPDVRLPTRGQALRRLVGMVLCAIPAGAGFLFVLVDDRRRGPHDRLAHTLVVHRDPDASTPVPTVAEEPSAAPVPSSGLGKVEACASS